MSLKIRWPKSGNRKIYLPAFILWTIFFGVNDFLSSLRTASDLSSTVQYCGVVTKYELIVQRMRGGSEYWVLTYRTAQNKKIAMSLTQSFRREALEQEGVKIGDDICVEFAVLPTMFGDEHLEYPVEIFVNNRGILSPSKVLNQYLAKSSFSRNMSIIGFIFIVFIVIRIEDEKWR